MLRIIEEHRPSAWVWTRLYPKLNDLSKEDREILDKISPLQFVDEVTEQDLRNIIEHRKKNRKSEVDKKKEREALAYYEKHKKEIESEERGRKKATSVAKWAVLGGISLLSAGISLHSYIGIVIGSGLITLGPLSSISKLRVIDSSSVAPKKKQEVVKFNLSDILFMVSYLTAFIATGILIGSFLVWAKAGWDIAARVMSVGGVTMVVAAILLVLAVIVTPSSGE